MDQFRKRRYQGRRALDILPKIAAVLCVLTVLMGAGLFVSYQYSGGNPQGSDTSAASSGGVAGGNFSIWRPYKPSGGTQSKPKPGTGSTSIVEPDPEPRLAWNTTPVLTEEQMPGDYNGLELPVQGATGYTSIELPLWQSLEDMQAALDKENGGQEGETEGGAEGNESGQMSDSSTASPLSNVTGGLLSLLSVSSSSASADTAQPGAGAASSSPGGAAEGTQPPDGTGEAQPPDSSAGSEISGSQDNPPPDGQEPPEGGEAGGRPARDPNREAVPMTMLPPGTPFTIVQEEEGWWLVQCEAEYKENEEVKTGELLGWVEHRYCMINLPDVIPSIIYDDTNGYSSLFVSCGKILKGITGEALYTGKTENPRLGQEEFMMPVLYSMAPRLCAAQRAALSEGNCLVLYEGYRPLDTQLRVANALRALMKQDEEVKQAVSSAPWSISWFIATDASNHQHGYAVDVSLARISTMQVHTSGSFRYLRARDYELYDMPTDIHELSRAAATFTAPVASNSMTAWRNAALSPSMNETALGLQGYCTGAMLTPLSSEWWHFNDLTSRSNVLDNLGRGGFEITTCRSVPPVTFEAKQADGVEGSEEPN